MAIIMTAVGSMLIFSMDVVEGYQQSDYNFEVRDGEVTVTRYTGSASSVVVPSELGGYPVVGIGFYSFKETKVASVVIPDGVTWIGDDAFYNCIDLTSVAIPDTVTFVGDYTFFQCSSLQSITIPENVTSIDNGTFRGCSALTSVIIPGNVTYIGNLAFSNCIGLTQMTIPQSVTWIGYMAFDGCRSLTDIDVEAGNSNYTSVEGVVYNKNLTVLSICPGGKSGSFTVPHGVSTIGYRAFFQCSALTSVNISGGVTGIYNFAFEECSLTSVDIPDSVTSIALGAFKNCRNLTSVKIPDSVTSIADGVFYGCSALTSVNLPVSLNFIEDHAFLGCGSLTSITIPESVTSIGYSAFAMSGLTSITIPDSVVHMGYDAFNECPLTTASIGQGMEAIPNGTFTKCSSLSTITIPIGVTTIGGWAFSGSGLTSISLPEGLTHIGEGAFSYCPLESISIPYAVTYIGEAAFLGCPSLTYLVIPEGVTSIEGYTFWNCSSLSHVSIPENVTTVGYGAFAYCGSLNALNIPDNVTDIGGYALYESGLTSVTLGSGLKSIGDLAFSGCIDLTSISFLGSVAPTHVGQKWINNTSAEIRGHAFAASDFPSPGEVWHGLTMGDNIEGLSPPSEPSGLTAVPGDADVTLTWNDTMADGGSPTIGYHIYWSTEIDGDVAVITTNSTNYTHQGLDEGSTYHYQVSAFNSNGESDRSSIVNVTLSTTSAPSTPAPFLYTIEGQVALAGLVILSAGVGTLSLWRWRRHGH
jgi:hypothetical protein